MEKRLIDLKVSDSIARIELNDPENFNILTEPLKPLSVKYGKQVTNYCRHFEHGKFLF